MKRLNGSTVIVLSVFGTLSFGVMSDFAQSSPSPSPTPVVQVSSSATAKLRRIFGTTNPGKTELLRYAKSHPGQCGNISVTLGEAGVTGSTLIQDIQYLGQGILNSGKSASVVNFSLQLLYDSALNVATTAQVQAAFSNLIVPPKYSTSVNINAITGPEVSAAS